MNLKEKLRHVYDFPKPGVDFIDITTVLADGESLVETINQMQRKVADLDFDLIIGSESRGFIMGTPLAYSLKKGFIPVRKAGKLPYETVSVKYDLEYGQDLLEMHVDAVAPGQRVLVVDDLLATGGTARAMCQLVEQLGGIVAGVLFFVELEQEFDGRKNLPGYEVFSIVKF